MALQDVKLCVSGRRQRFSSDRMWALHCKAWIYRKTCNRRFFSYPNPSTKLATSFSLASSWLEDWKCKNCQRRQNHPVWTKWAAGMTGMYAIFNSIRVLALFPSYLLDICKWSYKFTSCFLLIDCGASCGFGAGVQAICIASLPRRCRPSFRARFGCRPRSLFLAEHTPIFWAQSWNCFWCMLKMSSTI